MTFIFIAAATFVATLLGGLFALRLRDRLHLILGFSAGAVIAVAFFDLLPESLELASAYGPHTVLAVAAIGFLLYLAIDRAILIHGHQHDHSDDSDRGYFSAGTLSLHSFLDGLAVGFALQLSPALGVTVAIAVIAHDFSDGVNTVNMILKSGGSNRSALLWLVADALAPIVGIVVGQLTTVSENTLGLVLAFFGGLFLYLGASDLIPESHHAHPVRWTTISTILGAAVLYAVIQVAGI